MKYKPGTELVSKKDGTSAEVIPAKKAVFIQLDNGTIVTCGEEEVAKYFTEVEPEPNVPKPEDFVGARLHENYTREVRVCDSHEGNWMYKQFLIAVVGREYPFVVVNEEGASSNWKYAEYVQDGDKYKAL